MSALEEQDSNHKTAELYKSRCPKWSHELEVAATANVAAQRAFDQALRDLINE